MKKFFKLFKAMQSIAAIAFVAIIGFSMAACKDDDSSSNAPTRLTATPISSTEINIAWDEVDGAVGYKIYNSLSEKSGFQLLGVAVSNSVINNQLPANTTVYYKVSAVFVNQKEGDLSAPVSAKTMITSLESPFNGVWYSEVLQITVSNGIGVITNHNINIASKETADAIRKGYFGIGVIKWKDLYQKTIGSDTWYGKNLLIKTSGDTATGTTWQDDCRFTLSVDRNTLTTYSPNANNPTVIYTRKTTIVGGGVSQPSVTLSLDGSWRRGDGRILNISGNTGYLIDLGTLGTMDPILLWTSAVNQNYIYTGMTYWRNLTSTGNLKWSGEWVGVRFYTSDPTVAIGTGWGTGATWTLSADGNTLTVNGPNGPTNEIWTRVSSGGGGGSGGGSSGGTFTLTGIPSQYNGKYACLVDIKDGVLFVGAQNVTSEKITCCLISNGSVSLPMWNDSGNNYIRYYGNDTLSYPSVQIIDSMYYYSSSDPMEMVFFDEITFYNGSATKSYNQKAF